MLSEYRWPPEHPAELPALPGYVLSSFSPLVAAAAAGCLARVGVPDAGRERTAVLLVSAGNDLVSAEYLHDRVATGRRVGPLLFFQAAPNSVVGQLSAQHGLGGPVVCISPVGDPLADAMAEAELVLEDGDADEVLAILVEQAEPVDTASGRQALPDRAHALLLSRNPLP